MDSPLIFHESLGSLDWIVIVAYAAGMIGLGLWYFFQQTDIKEYFIAGKGMGSLIVGISQCATLVSTISYLASPGETIKHGPVMLASIFSLPFAYLIVAFWLIPRLVRERQISAYGLLEARLGVEGRLLGAGMFVLLRLMWMTAMIYITSRAMVPLFGFGPGAEVWLAIGLGFVVVIYTVLGGIRAVLVTDFFQFIFLFGGALLTIGCITWAMGGFSWFPTQWDPNWSRQPILPDSVYVRVSLLGTIVHFTVWYACTAGGDQMMVQRFMSTPNVNSARRSYLWNQVAYACVLPILGLVGFSLMGFFKQYPQGVAAARDADDYFLVFIAHYLPRGFAGLVVVALCAAAMSSMSSGISSVSSVVMSDFIGRFRKQDRAGTQKQGNDVRTAMMISVVVGVLIVLASSLVGKVEGNITDIAFKTANLLTAPLFGLFFLVFFVPFAKSFGAIWGAIYGMAAAIYLAFWHKLTGDDNLSIQWITVGSLAVDLLFGVCCCLMPVRRESVASWLFWSLLAAIPLVGWIVLIELIY